jgi:pimeloyl-ACP methyl ester carboxylesterase
MSGLPSAHEQAVRRIIRTVLVVVSLVVLAALLGVILIHLREPDEGKALPPGVSGRLIDVGGRRVHVVELGSGPVLLLVHGFGASTYDFEEAAIEPLAKSHRVIAVDLYGFGWSERSDDFRYGWTLWADELYGTLDSLGVERASVLGHSMGGAVAAVFAARHPERIDRLVLADALYPAEPGETPVVFRILQTPILGELALGLVADLSAPGFSPTHGERAQAWCRIAGTRQAALRYVRDTSKRAELAAAYPQIAAPTLILHGTEDVNVPLAAAERTAPAIRNARVVRLTGGSHFPFRDAPDAFQREVEAFLSEP